MDGSKNTQGKVTHTQKAKLILWLFDLTLEEAVVHRALEISLDLCPRSYTVKTGKLHFVQGLQIILNIVFLRLCTLVSHQGFEFQWR